MVAQASVIGVVSGHVAEPQSCFALRSIRPPTTLSSSLWTRSRSVSLSSESRLRCSFFMMIPLGVRARIACGPPAQAQQTICRHVRCARGPACSSPGLSELPGRRDTSPSPRRLRVRDQPADPCHRPMSPTHVTPSSPGVASVIDRRSPRAAERCEIDPEALDPLVDLRAFLAGRLRGRGHVALVPREHIEQSGLQGAILVV